MFDSKKENDIVSLLTVLSNLKVLLLWEQPSQCQPSAIQNDNSGSLNSINKSQPVSSEG